MVLGSVTAGWVALITFLVLALAGMLLAACAVPHPRPASRRLRAGAFLIGGSFRSPINRYVSTVAPILMVLALFAIYAGVRRATRPMIATGVVVVGAAGDHRRQPRQRQTQS